MKLEVVFEESNPNLPVDFDNSPVVVAGKDGKSAYEIAVDHGFVGTEEEWLESLQGVDGKDGKDGVDGINGIGIKSVEQTYTSTADDGNNIITITLTNGSKPQFRVQNGSKGSTGKKGEDGYTPIKGVDYFTEAEKTELVNDVLAALPNGDGVNY